jgi:hypothetical protein
MPKVLPIKWHAKAAAVRCLQRSKHPMLKQVSLLAALSVLVVSVMLKAHTNLVRDEHEQRNHHCYAEHLQGVAGDTRRVVRTGLHRNGHDQVARATALFRSVLDQCTRDVANITRSSATRVMQQHHTAKPGRLSHASIKLLPV